MNLGSCLGCANIQSITDEYNAEGSGVEIPGGQGECNLGRWEREHYFWTAFGGERKRGGGERRVKEVGKGRQTTIA